MPGEPRPDKPYQPLDDATVLIRVHVGSLRRLVEDAGATIVTFGRPSEPKGWESVYEPTLHKSALPTDPAPGQPETPE